jgi:hypothetical protein
MVGHREQLFAVESIKNGAVKAKNNVTKSHIIRRPLFHPAATPGNRYLCVYEEKGNSLSLLG